MSCTKLDEIFQLYLLALLIEMQGTEGKEVPIPSTIAVKECNINKHRSYVKTLENLTSANYGLAKDLTWQAGFGGALSALIPAENPEGRPNRGKMAALTKEFQCAFSSAL